MTSVPSGWGPQGRDFAVCLTFDNLGEYAEIQAGVLPPDTPRGSHRSVSDGLPWLLELLEERPATFFVEGRAAIDYPNALRMIAAAGKEVALHGWEHEPSARLGPEEESLLAKAIASMRSVSIKVSGFRPPGGPPSRNTFALLRSHGLAYASCVGSRSGMSAEVPVLAYEWEAVDAYHFEPHLGRFRQARRGDATPSSADEYLSAVDAALARAAAARGVCVLVWHPYLLIDDAQRVAFAEAMTRVDSTGAWVASCESVSISLSSPTKTPTLAVVDAAGW